MKNILGFNFVFTNFPDTANEWTLMGGNSSPQRCQTVRQASEIYGISGTRVHQRNVGDVMGGDHVIVVDLQHNFQFRLLEHSFVFKSFRKK